MEKRNINSAKRRTLAQNGTLNRHADKVVDPRFRNMAFFDPDDLLQVKYEMLRYAQKEGAGVIEASEAFGFSRITFYKAEKAFKECGIFGLLPRKKGPRRAHKMTGKVLEFVEELTDKKPDIRSEELAEKVKDRFGISVHKRSIERATNRSKKKQQNIK
jgi:transposase